LLSRGSACVNDRAGRYTMLLGLRLSFFSILIFNYILRNKLD
jgi:hypothetical protein